MSNKERQSASRLPEGYTEEEINEMAEEAYKNGELEAVDLLGNSQVIEPIMDEMFSGKERPIDLYNVISVTKHLQGDVLTVIDATFTDEKRIKYVKDLIKRCFTEVSGSLYNLSLRKE